MNNLYFQVSDFVIEPSIPISQDVANKILVHLWLINQARIDLGHYILVSQNSGYRSVKYEKKKKRSGFSEHCYIGKGAADYTCDKEKIQGLVEWLKSSDYKRVCYYPKDNFIHCDFKGHQKQYFVCMGKKWKLQ